MNPPIVIVIVMGVSGAGKTTVGEALARRLGLEFLDADEFHPPQNVAKMAAAIPLTDLDRWPWLERLNRELATREAAGRGAVLACSALKDAYRSRLFDGIAGANLVFLDGSIEFIRERMKTRRHKYMPAALLESQFATLEPPRDAIEIDATLGVEAAVEKIAAELGRKQRGNLDSPVPPLVRKGPARTP